MHLRGIVTGTVVAASVATAALADASPAAATDQITRNAVGTYEFRIEWGTNIWNIDPCADDSDQCIQVTESDAGDLAGNHVQWTANAYWSVGSWILRVDEPGVVCKDGSIHNIPVTYSWNAATNEGSRSGFDPGICGGQPASFTNPFTLSLIAPR